MRHKPPNQATKAKPVIYTPVVLLLIIIVAQISGRLSDLRGRYWPIVISSVLFGGISGGAGGMSSTAIDLVGMR